ncbi:MAG: ATPase domain-containing protein [archaeon]
MPKRRREKKEKMPFLKRVTLSLKKRSLERQRAKIAEKRKRELERKQAADAKRQKRLESERKAALQKRKKADALKKAELARKREAAAKRNAKLEAERKRRFELQQKIKFKGHAERARQEEKAEHLRHKEEFKKEKLREKEEKHRVKEEAKKARLREKEELRRQKALAKEKKQGFFASLTRERERKRLEREKFRLAEEKKKAEEQRKKQAQAEETRLKREMEKKRRPSLLKSISRSLERGKTERQNRKFIAEKKKVEIRRLKEMAKAEKARLAGEAKAAKLRKKGELRLQKEKAKQQKIKERQAYRARATDGVSAEDVHETKKEDTDQEMIPSNQLRQLAAAQAPKGKLKAEPSKWVTTGIPGFDELTTKGIPKGSTMLVAGGPGSGKTIFCLQTLYHGLESGETCLYITLEEPPDSLRQHMEDFGWDPRKYEKQGKLTIHKIDPFSVSRSIAGLLAKARNEIRIDIGEIGDLIPSGIKPDRIIIDSISALAAAFTEKDAEYRIYVEQLFNYLKKIGSTSFLISETVFTEHTYSKTGIEEFLADGVIVMYNVTKGNLRSRAIEILKLRGAEHKQKIVPMTINTGSGIKVYPSAEVFEQI